MSLLSLLRQAKNCAKAQEAQGGRLYGFPVFSIFVYGPRGYFGHCNIPGGSTVPHSLKKKLGVYYLTQPEPY